MLHECDVSLRFALTNLRYHYRSVVKLKLFFILLEILNNLGLLSCS